MFRYGSVDTPSFVALVSARVGHPMNDFFDQWLNAPVVPPLPR